MIGALPSRFERRDPGLPRPPLQRRGEVAEASRSPGCRTPSTTNTIKRPSPSGTIRSRFPRRTELEDGAGELEHASKGLRRHGAAICGRACRDDGVLQIPALVYAGHDDAADWSVGDATAQLRAALRSSAGHVLGSKKSARANDRDEQRRPLPFSRAPRAVRLRSRSLPRLLGACTGRCAACAPVPLPAGDLVVRAAGRRQCPARCRRAITRARAGGLLYAPARFAMKTPKTARPASTGSSARQNAQRQSRKR